MATNLRKSQRFIHRKQPHLVKQEWVPTVPQWEKKFCSKVGAVPWTKLVETKKYLSLYENVMNWDDSACKEAFDNAKKRFLASINGIPSNISMPDPDTYIDDIDWNNTDNDDYIMELENEEKVSIDEGVVILDTSILYSHIFGCIGWGDAEEEYPSKQNTEAVNTA